MNPHLLFAALTLLLAASTLQLSLRGAPKPAVAVAHVAAPGSGPGFTGAFGRSAVVRNLLF